MATELGNGLAERGHEVHFITYQQPVRLAFHPNIYFHEVAVPTYPLFDFPPYESALTSTLVSVIQNHNLDVLHVHYAIPHASSAYFAKQILKSAGKHIPFITTLHGTDITLVGKDPTYKPVVTFSMAQSDAITAVSHNLREETYRSFDIGQEIEVIPNFVDLRRFRQTDKDHFKKMLAPNGERILAHVSNFRKIKRVPDVVKIFAQVRAQMPSKLLMIGDGPERQHAEEVARCLGVFNDVRFLGKQDQLDEILSITDLFLLPSEYESFGLAALEAMACGVPVISSNAGGLGEINVEGETGFLCPVGDVDGMAAKAIEMLQSEELLLKLKEGALKQAAHFSREKSLAQYEELYRKVSAEVLV